MAADELLKSFDPWCCVSMFAAVEDQTLHSAQCYTLKAEVLWKRLPGVAEGASAGCGPPAWALSWQHRASDGCMLRNCENSLCWNIHKLTKIRGSVTYTHTWSHTHTWLTGQRHYSIGSGSTATLREIERITGEWALPWEVKVINIFMNIFLFFHLLLFNKTTRFKFAVDSSALGIGLEVSEVKPHVDPQ